MAFLKKEDVEERKVGQPDRETLLKEEIAEFFKADDKNKDGFVSFDEYSGPKVTEWSHDEL